MNQFRALKILKEGLYIIEEKTIRAYLINFR